MITIKLTHQQLADLLLYYFPYMKQWCQLQVNENQNPDYYGRRHILAVIMQRTINDMQDLFELRRLQHKGSATVKCKAAAAAWLLLATVISEVPINKEQFYLVYLRANLLATIYTETML